MSGNSDLQVYIFQDNEGEEVPRNVEKLIVEEGVKVLPDELCSRYHRLQEVTLSDGLIKIGNGAFCDCANLLSINVCSSVQHIGEGAFNHCTNLKKAEFDVSTSLPLQLQRIREGAFLLCVSLQRVKLPPSVTFVGTSAFHCCRDLVEANLSTTAVTEISEHTFYMCPSLQTVSLPKTVSRIRCSAFDGCRELVTVVVPLDLQSIRVYLWSFCNCRRLSNLVLPKGSTAHRESFQGCTLLHEHYGEDSSLIVSGLMDRFENFCIHRMCYDHSVTPVEELQQRITAKYKEDSLVDKFGMTPFHVFFSTIEPRIELLEVLLDLLPTQILKCKDANGRRPLNYLIKNWTDGSKRLCHRTLEKSVIDPLARWGAKSWMETMQSEVQDILVEEDRRHRGFLLNEVYSALEQYENVQATSILEMALWKGKLKSGWTSDGTKRQALDREECRCVSGSDVVIPHVCIFFITPLSSDSDEGSSSDEDDSSHSDAIDDL